VAVGNFTIDANYQTTIISSDWSATGWVGGPTGPLPFTSGTSIAWNGSVWVAGGKNGANYVVVATSPDAVTWTVPKDTFAPFPLDSIANTISLPTGPNNKWIIGGYNGSDGIFSTSNDGITWTGPTGPTSGVITEVISIKNGGATGPLYVAVTRGTNTFLHCTDPNGSVWVAATGPGQVEFTQVGNSLAFNGSYWVAAGENPSVLVSTDWTANSWRTIANPQPFAGGFANSVIWDSVHSQWIATSGGNYPTIATSNNGDTWTTLENPKNPFTDGSCNGIAWNGSYWVAVGTNSISSTTIAKSYDGVSWTHSGSIDFGSQGGNAVAWNGSYWVAVGGINITVLISTDGTTWNPAIGNGPLSGFGSLNTILWDGQQWLATNASGEAFYSLDGYTWTLTQALPFTSVARIASANITL
jgi:hypothetical protein